MMPTGQTSSQYPQPMQGRPSPRTPVVRRSGAAGRSSDRKHRLYDRRRAPGLMKPRNSRSVCSGSMVRPVHSMSRPRRSGPSARPDNIPPSTIRTPPAARRDRLSSSMGYPGIACTCAGEMAAGPAREMTRSVAGASSLSARSTARTPSTRRPQTVPADAFSPSPRARTAKWSSGYRSGTSSSVRKACPRRAWRTCRAKPLWMSGRTRWIGWYSSRD
ncbi:MAG TPA: hypothetical protein VFJ30_07645 [Phycisphaerae bacterium]|nr:hypothetical protein [Phycisphaerae bacterium]